MPEHPFDNGQLIIRDEQLADTPRQPEEIKRHILEYYAMISHLDVQVGRIMDALERSGQLDNTIIVFAGDNGLAVGQHGLMGKQNLYQHSVNVPLLMAGPGIPRGDSTPALCYLIDLFPTLCDLAGAKVPNGLDGRSLVPVIKREQKTVRNVLHLQYKDLQGAIRKGNTKLIRYWVDGLETLQLFDLEQDPREVRNLAGQYPEKVSVLKRELLEWDKQHGLASRKSQK